MGVWSPCSGKGLGRSPVTHIRDPLPPWEAQVGPGLHPGRGLQEGARDESLVTGAEGSRRFRPGPYQLHHLQPVTLSEG